jgi:hypothetical protein
MPMQVEKDFAMGDVTKDYCTHCARQDGTMQSFEEKLEGMTNFILKTQGFDKEAAKKAALELMRKLPAWQGCF